MDLILQSYGNENTSRTNTSQFSHQSILFAIDRFVKAVNNMNSIVLVPSKLKDMSTCKRFIGVPASAFSDLYGLYNMLNDIKKESIWGPKSDISDLADRKRLKHLRQSSDDSLISLGSTFCSDAESDSEIDSLITDKEQIDDHILHLTVTFRYHLQGSQAIFNQLTKYADALSTIYQEEVDS